MRWRRQHEPRWAWVFVDDLLRGCRDLVAVYGGPVVTLPITIPIDQSGLVLLRPQGPLDAPRMPATLDLHALADGSFGLRIERPGGEPMVIPGLLEAGRPDAVDASITALRVVVTGRGLDITAEPGPVRFDEQTARALATALLITIGMKLTKAQRGDDR
jgi:hypothetical protein